VTHPINDQPDGIDERPDQLRPPIVRSAGTTASERHLAKLADRSFLDLWSYPNPFRDEKLAPDGDGKEICDLLVVCGRHVIIFSEKNIGWSHDQPVAVAWPRWYNKAVRAAVKQIVGAEKWIDAHPDRIFLDPKCKTALPIAMPTRGERIIHRVVVARGAGDACRNHFKGGSGSFLIKPEIRGDDHWKSVTRPVEPFVIGDIDPAGAFVHVLDDTSLDIILNDRDTITDFTEYLGQKEEFIRAGRLRIGASEEDLLAYYSIRINADGAHDFTHPDDRPWRAGEQIDIDGGRYARFSADPRFKARQEADKDSYLWDELIRQFTTHMLDGTSITPDGSAYDLRSNEKTVRYMALECRFRRRSHASAIIGAIERGRGKDQFFRSMLPEAHSRDPGTAFFFLQVAHNDKMKRLSHGSYDRYREYRTALATLYARGMLLRYPYRERIVGIAMEHPEPGKGNSEDLIYAGQHQWSDEERAEIEATCAAAGIMKPDPVTRRYDGQEFPEVEPTESMFILPPPPALLVPLRGSGVIVPGFGAPIENRAQRRARLARERKG
jgi:hypothetical protein